MPRSAIGASVRRNALRPIVAAAVVAGCAAAMTAVPAVAAPPPAPVPSAPPGDVSGGIPWSGWGVSDWVGGWINSWFANLVALAVEPMLKVLAETLLSTPDVTGNARVHDLWQASAVIANSSFVLLATAGAITAMVHGTVQTRYAVKEVLPRLLVAVLATNASLTICGKVIELANALSRALLGQDFDGRRALTTLRFMILPPAQNESFHLLLALVAVVLLILLLIAFVMRAALVLLLVVAAPLALACLAFPHTDGLARFWWRAFTGLLFAQVAQSLTLVVAVRIFFNQDGRLLLGLVPSGQLVNLVLAICLLIIMVRIPRWTSRRIFAQTAGRGSTVTRIIKYALAYKLTSPVLNALHLGRGSVRPSGGVRAAHPVNGRALPPRRPPGPSGPGGPAGSGGPRPSNGPAPRGGPGRLNHPPAGTRHPRGSSALITHASLAPPLPPQPWKPPGLSGTAGPGQVTPGQHRPSPPGRLPVPPAVFLPPAYRGTAAGDRRTPPVARPGDAGGERT